MKVYTFYIRLGLTSHVFPLLWNLWNLRLALSLPDCSLLGLLETCLAHTHPNSGPTTWGKLCAALEGSFCAAPSSEAPCPPNPAVPAGLNSVCFLCPETLLLSAWAHIHVLGWMWDTPNVLSFAERQYSALVAVQCLQLVFYTICVAFICCSQQ